MRLKCTWKSHWTPVNITEDIIERYDNFNTKGCPEDLDFGDFNNQPIPFTYSDLIDYYDDDGTPIYDTLAYNGGVEDAVVPNYEDTNDEITTYNDNSLTSEVDLPPPKLNSVH